MGTVRSLGLAASMADQAGRVGDSSPRSRLVLAGLAVGNAHRGSPTMLVLDSVSGLAQRCVQCCKSCVVLMCQMTHPTYISETSPISHNLLSVTSKP